MWVRLVLKVLLETRVRKVQQDLKVQLEQLAQSDQQGRRVSKVFRVLLDLLDPKGRLVLLVHKDRQGRKGLRERLVLRDLLDRKGHKVLRAQRVRQVRKALLDQQAQRVPQVVLRLWSISNTMSLSLGTL
jgi:hypothetical protein